MMQWPIELVIWVLLSTELFLRVEFPHAPWIWGHHVLALLYGVVICAPLNVLLVRAARLIFHV